MISIILLTLKVILINMVAIFMMSSKLDTLGLLKIKLFWNKGYEVIISVHDVTNKILSSDSNYIVDVVMWPKLLTLKNFFERNYHKDLTSKTNVAMRQKGQK